LTDAVGGLGKLHLLAAFRSDEHARRDNVEAPGAQARDERAEFGEDAVDLLDAHARQDRLRHLRRFAGELAARRGITIGRLIGEADTDIAVLACRLERALREGGSAET